jgi:hypothetical protein
MKNTLSDCYNESNTLFVKYPEPWKDYTTGGKFDFYAWEYWPETIHTEEARFIPIIWDSTDIMVWEWAFTKEMSEYYSNTYPDTFSAKNVKTYSPQSYYESIQNSVKNNTLIVLHPYMNIDTQKYALSPELIFWLNDKTRMSELTSFIPKSQVLEYKKLSQLKNFPFVLKAHSWASWDGVRIIHKKSELSAALKYFSTEKELLVEDFIDINENYNVQLCIGQNWDIELLWVSFQNTTAEGEYNGNTFYKNTQIPQNVSKIAFEVCENAYKRGYYGVCWLDIVSDYTNNALLIDPNFRLNGSTSTLLLQNKIFDETDSSILQFSSFSSKHTDISWMLNANSDLWNDSLYLLSAFKNTVNGLVSGHAITFWNDLDELTHRKKILSHNWFTL